jgi:hypothetical protein
MKTVTPIAGFAVSAVMSTIVTTRKGASAKNRRRWASVVRHGLLATCIAAMMWLHALVPATPQGDAVPASMVINASQEDAIDEMNPSASDSEGAGRPVSGALPLVIALVVLALAIKAIGVALQVVLTAAAKLIALLLTNVAVFVVVLVMLLAHLAVPDVM